MGYKFNKRYGMYICDHCNKTMFDYMPSSFLEQFLADTYFSGKFKEIEVWSKVGNDERFCSSMCLKGFYSENDSFVRALYSD